MSREAMKLALEAAYLAGWNASGEGYNAEYPFGDHARNPEEDAAWLKDRDNALQEALAEQPAQQEPVAWVCYGAPGKRDIDFEEADINRLPIGTQLYTSPPAQRTWVSLTDEEIYSVLENLQVMHHRPPTTESRVIFALAIEAKLRSKNEDRN